MGYDGSREDFMTGGSRFSIKSTRTPRAQQEVTVKRFSIVLLPFVAALVLVAAWWTVSAPLVSAQQPLVNPPRIAFDSVPDYFKYPPDMNLGEVLAVAVNSKGHVLILNHPGSATSGPLYGNATTQLLEFDPAGKFVGEVGKGVYGLG